MSLSLNFKLNIVFDGKLKKTEFLRRNLLQMKPLLILRILLGATVLYQITTIMSSKTQKNVQYIKNVEISHGVESMALNRAQYEGLRFVRTLARYLDGYTFKVETAEENLDLAESNAYLEENSNVIHINIEAGNAKGGFGDYAITEAMTHEIGHAIRKDAPRLYEELKSFIKENFYSEGGWDSAVSARQSQYKGKIGEFAWAKAEEEVVCNSLGRMLASQRVMNKLAKGHRTLFGRIWKSVIDFLDRLISRIRGVTKYSNKTTEQRVVEESAAKKQKELEKLFVTALREANTAARAIGDVNAHRRAQNAKSGENSALTNTKQENVKVSRSLAEENKKITANMSDEERYEVLKKRSIDNVPIATDIPAYIIEKMPEISSWDDINKYFGKDKRNVIQKLVKEFGTFDKEYFNDDIELKFEFSGNNFRESYNKQGHHYIEFAKMFSVFDTVIENAVGVEMHNRANYKPDPTLNNVFVLISAYQDGDFIVPVKLEVKKFKDKKNTLYVAISLEKIKKTEVWKQGDTNNGVTQNSRSVNISISNIFRKINPFDKSFLKYIPDGFLNDEQKNAKIEALEEDTKKSEKSFSLADSADREALAEAFYNLAATDAERIIVRQYRDELRKVDEMLADRTALARRYEELKGVKSMAAERTRVNAQIYAINDFVTKHDKKLLELSSAAPFREMMRLSFLKCVLFVKSHIDLLTFSKNII